MAKLQPIRKEKSMGDWAVDGLMAGFVAGAVMALYLIIAGLLSQNSLTDTLALFDPAQAGNWLTGLAAHLAVSGIYGVIFALVLSLLWRIQPSLSRISWLLGLLYALLLFGLAQGVLLTAVDFPLREISSAHFAIAHTIYGLILGYWFATK